MLFFILDIFHDHFNSSGQMSNGRLEHYGKDEKGTGSKGKAFPLQA
jgi:hypothetical protein